MNGSQRVFLAWFSHITSIFCIVSDELFNVMCTDSSFSLCFMMHTCNMTDQGSRGNGRWFSFILFLYVFHICPLSDSSYETLTWICFANSTDAGQHGKLLIITIFKLFVIVFIVCFFHFRKFSTWKYLQQLGFYYCYGILLLFYLSSEFVFFFSLRRL